MTLNLKQFNALPKSEATSLLKRCCGASEWAKSVSLDRPFSNVSDLMAAAETRWKEMKREDYLEAFSHHPKIGGDLDSLRKKFAATEEWSSEEQESVNHASEEVLKALRDGNQRYEQTYGYIFIVCATGKSAPQMLALLQARLGNPPEVELELAAAEQAKITRIRLEKLEL